MDNHTFVTARFTNNDRTTIKATWRDNSDESVYRNSYVVVDENSIQYKEILELISVDQLHENTVNAAREERKQFEEIVFSIAAREGLIEQRSQSDDLNTFLNCVLTYNDDKEFLFKLKLKMFELDKLKESENRIAKSQLRKAQTITEVLKAFDKF